MQPGARLGPYEIQSLLGAGGMGEVYRARDTKLNRDVALKILPDAFANDPDRFARFTREAQTLAALNHPHIAHVHGLEESGGVRALVMELVEGEDLARRLARGRIPVDEALPVARQIALALEAAHEQGIVHRDLKPANIKVRPDGTVKVLDFGLAKMLEPVGGSSLSMSPTMSVHATYAGTILGTAAYMSPEQARGKVVDRRTDIWAFGCVLFEMLTGRRTFEGGDSVSDAVAAILKNEPDWNALPAGTPAYIRSLLRRCLRKDPQARLQAIGDARIAIEEGPAEDAVPARQGKGGRVPWFIAAGALVAAVALAIPAVRYARQSAPEPVQTRFEIQTPPTSDSGSFALSDDGRQLAFVATAEGTPRLWVRPLDQVNAKPLADTDGASYPFWAPDGKAIGFFADGKLKRIDLGGAASQVLANAPGARGGTWSRDGVIVFAPSAASPLMRVAAAAGGGTPAAVTVLAAGHGSHRFPQFLTDGRRFLFYVGFGRRDTAGVYLATLDGGQPTRVLAAESAAVFVPPRTLLFVRQGVLVAVSFDTTRGVVSGDPIPVAQPAETDFGVARGVFAASATGVLALRAGGGVRRQLVWVNRAGTVTSTLGPPDAEGIANPEISPDGQRVAVHRVMQGNGDIWLLDVGRGVPTRFTYDSGSDTHPTWSSDGRRVVFRSSRKGAFDLFEKPATGVGDEQLLLATADNKTPLSWSRDGRFLLYVTQNAQTGTDLWALPLEGRKPFSVVQTPFTEAAGQFSPDGRWVAFQSDESGREEIYIRPFPAPGGQRLVSTAGGSQPRWRPDGNELFYVAPDARLMAVPMTPGADRQTLEPGSPVPLFVSHLATGANISVGGLSKPQYAVASDGRFLMNVALEGTASPITVVLNWDAALKR